MAIVVRHEARALPVVIFPDYRNLRMQRHDQLLQILLEENDGQEGQTSFASLAIANGDIRVLPDEILAEIFQVGGFNPLAICRVSRQFHYVAATTPQLWQCVPWHCIPQLPQIRQRVLRLYLNNSGGLSLAFHFPDDIFMDTFISEELRMDRGENPPHVIRLAHLSHHGFNAAISEVFPLSRSLCSLSLEEVEGRSWGNFILEAIWVRGLFPRLEKLDLEFKNNRPRTNLQLGGDTQELPTLLSLALRHILLPAQDFQRIIESCQNIKYLKVYIGVSRPLGFPVEPLVIVLPKLERFVLLHYLERPYFSIVAPKLIKASFASFDGGPSPTFHHLSVCTRPPSNLVTLKISFHVPQTIHTLQFLRTPAISAALRTINFEFASAKSVRHIIGLLEALRSDLRLCPELHKINFKYGPFCTKKVMERAVLPMIRARKQAGMDLRVIWNRLELCDEERWISIALA